METSHITEEIWSRFREKEGSNTLIKRQEMSCSHGDDKEYSNSKAGGAERGAMLRMFLS